jgi:M6 family metalloprotease-like protein
MNILFNKQIFTSVFVLLFIKLWSAPIDFMPHTIFQPNGMVVECFVSGDEFFNWIHDAEGYTIIQADDGWYYYGKTENGLVVPTQHLVGLSNPVNLNLAPWAKISHQEYVKRRDAMWLDVESMKNKSVNAPHSGIMNNIVIYIRFSDDTEFTTIRQVYDDQFNPPTGNTVKSYFKEVSYDMLTINSTHYPACAMTTNLSYQSTNPRSYYQPYNASTNPNGYQNSTERRIREHTLLQDAIQWVNANSPIPSSLNIDGDNDGLVDNVCFIIKGNSGAWAELLWAHRWVLYTHDVYINGKQVWDYTFQPENQVSPRILSHELFHTLGAPDLYHYTNNGISPAGQWDIMNSGGGHMTAHMKWKYSNQTWIPNIPEITTSGTYTLHPLTSATNNSYKIASPYSVNEYFVVEYRKQEGVFESNLPGSGLIVYRVDPSINGNANGPPDELYVYRPNGTLTANGNPNDAHFSSNSGRTEINDITNPSSFLSDGMPGGLNIWGVTSTDSTISFNVGVPHTVTLSSNPAGAGQLNGGGYYFPNDTVTIIATPYSNNVFLNWTENGTIVSTQASFTFIINSNKSFEANFLTSGAVCDTISNIEGNSVNYTWSNNWGYVGGHSGRNFTEFAERFSSQTQDYVQGLYVGVAKAIDNNTPSPVTFHVYENGVTPGVILGSKTVTIESLVENAFNYIEFDTPIQTSGDYFIGYEIEYAAPHHEDTFSVYLSNYQSTSFNSAYAKTPTGWESYSNIITSVTFMSHLWIMSVNCSQVYYIDAQASPSTGGSVSGAGFYDINDTVTVEAIPNPGYGFLHWTENSIIVTTNPTYTFTATDDRVLVAHFQTITSQHEETLQSLTLFPNPSSHKVHIQQIPDETTLTVRDLQGRVLLKTKLNIHKDEINIQDFAAGLYLFTFSNSRDVITLKVIKK